MFFSRIREESQARGEYRLGRWGSFWHRFSLASWRWSMSLCLFEEGWALHLFCLWIQLWPARREPREIMESWGFHFDFHERHLYLTWGGQELLLVLPLGL